MDESVRKACATYAAHLALGHEVEDRPEARFVRFRPAPQVYDANFVQRVRAATPEATERVLAATEEWLAGFEHRQVLTDPETPAVFQAHLALEGYKPRPTLQMLLEGDLQGPAPAGVEIRGVAAPEDWTSVQALKRVRDVEDCEKAGRAPWGEEVTAQMVLAVQAKAPQVRFFLARHEGKDCAYFSSFPGVGGVGMLEDLFTLPEARGRGVARALIHHCAADARRRGAGRLLIGADPADTPRHAYAAMGFQPLCLTWAWLKTGAIEPRGHSIGRAERRRGAGPATRAQVLSRG